MLGLRCGAENQGVGVDPLLRVLVNVILAVTHKVFVFHRAALSAHPLCQPASLSPGINSPRSTQRMGHILVCLSVVPLSASANHIAQHSELCDVTLPPTNLAACYFATGWLPFVRAI